MGELGCAAGESRGGFGQRSQAPGLEADARAGREGSSDFSLPKIGGTDTRCLPSAFTESVLSHRPISDSWSGGRATSAMSEFRQLCKAVGHLTGARPPEGAGGKQGQGNARLDAVASASRARAEPALGSKIQVGEQSEAQHWSSSSQLDPLSTTWRRRGPTAIPFLHLDLGHSPSPCPLGGSKGKQTCMK